MGKIGFCSSRKPDLNHLLFSKKTSIGQWEEKTVKKGN